MEDERTKVIPQGYFRTKTNDRETDSRPLLTLCQDGLSSARTAAQLTYVRTEGAGSVGETFVFRCARHGVLILPPDGRIRQQPA
jgi:hypothetical protein